MKNVYRVPKSEWRKWGPEGQEAFNRLFGFMMDRPALFTHPKAPPPKLEHWKTLAWNVSWHAAGEVRAFVKEAKSAA